MTPDTSEEATRWDNRYRESGWVAQPDSRIVEIAQKLVPGTALDLGGGTGRHALWLAAHGWTVTCVDISKVGLSQAKERAVSDGVKLTCVTSSIHDFTPPEGGYDLVLLANIHPPSAERAELFADAARAVAPRGRLLVLGHDISALGCAGPPDPDRLFTVDSISTSLMHAGLDIESVDVVHDHVGDTGDAKDAVVVALAVKSSAL